jgi:S1-C subfamily serine protease
MPAVEIAISPMVLTRPATLATPIKAKREIMKTRWIALVAIAGIAAGIAFAAPCVNVKPYEARLGIQSSPVLIVSDVKPGSIADRAGLRYGDAIPISRVHATFSDALSRIREKALWRYADLEVISDGQKRHVFLRLFTPDDRFGFVSGVGFYVESVKAGSLGEKAGIKAGDFIRKVGDIEAGSMTGPGDMDLAIQQAVDAGKLSMELATLASAQGGTTLWNVRTSTLLSEGPLDGPTPPPKKPEITKQ